MGLGMQSRAFPVNTHSHSLICLDGDRCELIDGMLILVSIIDGSWRTVVTKMTINIVTIVVG